MRVFGESFRGREFVLETDSMVTVQDWEAGRSRGSADINDALLVVDHERIRCDVELHLRHLAGAKNGLADALSRALWHVVRELTAGHAVSFVQVNPLWLAARWPAPTC